MHPIRTAKLIRRYPLARKYLVHRENWDHASINKLNNQSEICLNILHPQSKDSLNMRAFETCCSGSFLLTQSNPALSRYFDVGREVEDFENPQEAAEKVVYYLTHNSAARRIAVAGRERVLKEHTMKDRIAQIIGMLHEDGCLSSCL